MINNLNDQERNSILVGRGATVFSNGEYCSALIFVYKDEPKQRKTMELQIAKKINCIADATFFYIADYSVAVILIKGIQVIDNKAALHILGSIFRKQKKMALSDGQLLYDLEKMPYRISKLIQLYEDYDNREGTRDFGLVICNQAQEHSTMVASATLDSLMYLFAQGEFDRLDKEIDEITELIRNQDIHRNPETEPTSIKRFFLELSSFSFHAMYDQGVDVDRILNYVDPYETIFSFDETPKIKKWYVDSCRKLYAEYERILLEKKSTLVRDIQAFVNKNIHDENLSVNQIAGSINLSPAYISSCYSRETGNTIIGYIIEKRIDKAKELLEGTNLTIGEISREVGYYSERYFYTVFKKNIGLTPSQYRKKQHKIQKK